MKIVFATANPHKVDELKAIAKLNGIDDIEFVLPPEGFDPQETGTTFDENSYIKAKEANKLTGMMSLADDSGLCVDALDDAPGLHSARYADTREGRIARLLKELEPYQNRKAKFVCSMTLLDENGNKIFNTLGECHGEIAHEEYGENGFGYDPIFIVENTGLTMSQMSEDEKNKISHRANAMQKVFDYLNSL